MIYISKKYISNGETRDGPDPPLFRISASTNLHSHRNPLIPTVHKDGMKKELVALEFI